MQKVDEDLQMKLTMFGYKLANQRKQMSLTQQHLAESIGTSQKVQSGYERGDAIPKIDYLFRLADVGFDIQQLLFAGENQGIYVLEHQEQTVLDLYRQANDSTKLQVLALLAGGNANQTEMNHQQGDLNQNVALIAGKQSIKTKKNQ